MSPVVVYTMGELKGHRIAELSFILYQSKPFWFELCVLGAFDTFTYVRKYYIYNILYIFRSHFGSSRGRFGSSICGSR